MFSKKSQTNTPTIDNQKPAVSDEVYIMPEKFHPRSGQSSNKLLIIVIIIFVVVAIGSAAYFLYDMWQKNQQLELTQTNVNVNQNTNIDRNINQQIRVNANVNRAANLNINRQVNVNTNTNVNVNQNINRNTNTNVNTNTNTNTNINVNLNANPLVPPDMASDTDNDGLTDLEENIFDTSSSQPDTDGDGYTDGQEVIYGFSPLLPGSGEESKISTSTSEFIRILTTNFTQDNFSVFYVKDWFTNIITATGQAFITTNTGEIIKISVRPNQSAISAANWYLQSHPQVALSQLRNIEVGDLSGVFSPDGLQAYLTNLEKTKFYVFEYLMDSNSPFRYPTIFTLIIKSFKLSEPLPLLPPLPDLENGLDSTSTATST